MNSLKHIVQVLLRLPRWQTFGAGALVAVAAVVGVRAFSSAAPAPAAPSETPHVTVASVGELASATGPLPLTGTVTSLSQATVLSQTSGQLTTLSRALGDQVAAGAVIATFDSASQQAAVLQAQGALDAAHAALARVQGSASQNSAATVSAALASGYSSLDDAVHTRADALFQNPRTSSPTLSITVPESLLVSRLNTERAALDPKLAELQSFAQATTTAVAQVSVQATADVQSVLAFLDDLIKAVNEAGTAGSITAASLATYQTSLAAARTETVAVLSGITAAKSSYDANDANAATAAVKQAQGALDAAEANLAKTVVRSPVNGTIISLPVNRGDYVGTNATIAVVSNPNALYVDAQVTPDDAHTLTTGASATIDGAVPGIITFIAPALDPSTGKIEVKVGITGSTATLTDGEVVTLSLSRATHTAPAKSEITIPIAAAKILPTGPAVFTVSTSSALVAHPIVLGAILGDRVVVVSGVTSDVQIVTDARGLSEGETVIVDSAPETSALTPAP